MGIRRACSYQATFQTPEAPSNYSDILVTISQKGVNLINKYRANLEIGTETVVLKLTQEETKLFEAGKTAQMQIRCFGGTYKAPGSAVFSLEVWPALNDIILGGE